MAQGASNLWLVVEDDPNDFALLQRACRRISPEPLILRVENGVEAQEYLTSICLGLSQRSTLPAVILSDIKMPRMDGFELLSWVRSHEALADIPFVIITGSDLQVDRDRAHALGANGYLVKPPLPTIIQTVEGLLRGDAPG